MKKTMKILSAVMAIAMLISVAILPVSAAAPNVSFRIELAPETERLDSVGASPVDNNVYRLDVFVTSDVRISGIALDINYDDSKFVPLGLDDSYAEYPADDDFPDVLTERRGQMADTQGYGKNGEVVSKRPMYFGPSHPTVEAQYTFKFVKKPAMSRILWSYEPVTKSLEIGECNDALVGSIYFQLLPGQTADGAVFTFGDAGKNGAKSVAYDATPVAGKVYVIGQSHATNILDKTTIGTPDYTYHEGAEVTSPLTRSQILVKQNTAHAADGFDLKVRSTISKDAMNALANNDIKANIKSLGFVVTDAASVDQAFVKDMLAKGLVEAKDSQGKTYKLGTTQALYDDGSANYQFGAVLTAAKSACPLTFNAFVQTADVNNTIFYAADETLTVDKIPF